MMLNRRPSSLLNIRHLAFEFAAVFSAALIALAAVRTLSGFPTSLFHMFGIAVCVGILYNILHAALGGYRSSWRFFSLAEAKAATRAGVIAAAGTAAAFYAAMPFAGWVIFVAAVIAGVIGPRLLVRVWHSHGVGGANRFADPAADIETSDDSKQVLLMIGFGDHVADFIRSQRGVDADYELAGVVHINSVCEANALRGVPVLGSINSLRTIVERLTETGKRPDFLVLTRDEMSDRTVGELLSIADKTEIPVAWLPRTDRIDPSSGQQLRPIKLDDLLPRSANQFDARACEDMMHESCVLVTGAGGSIGSELVRQISGLSPGNLILTDVSEHALYMIDQEVRRKFPGLSVTTKLLDVRDRDAVQRTMQLYRPHFVFHAAALKHVPIVEAQACEGVVTNVVGSRNVADACADAKVCAMVLVSTDKAVNPANVMGATKRLAEAYCQAMDAASADVNGGTRYITVRFGNVLGSSGSVVPLFQQQLANGGPLTVTHPDVERFFMTIPEASRLILQALLFGIGDANGDQGIFVLDMGEPVKIVDLARQVVRLSGLTPDSDIKIVYTGLRPGEKLYEELMHETENLLQTEHPSLMVAQPRFVQIRTVRSQIDVIRTAALAGESNEVLRLLKLYIPEYETTAREAESAKAKESSRAQRPEAI